MHIRKAEIHDIETLIKLRFDYLQAEKGPMPPAAQDDLRQKLTAYYNKWIPVGGFIACIAEDGGQQLSTAFMSIVERPPRYAFESYLVGTIYNVFTYETHRRKGIATKVLKALIAEAKQMGVNYIDLLATDDGKRLYEKLGFILPKYTSMRLT